ncbi:hypothetical protein ACVWZA_002048 [Sphingomonas sp. UYAg733]
MATDQLLPGEHIRWSGQPARGIVFSVQDIFLIPFSLMWCGFAIFWTFGATSSGAPAFFTLWGLMFVTVGSYFVVGRFAVDAWLRSRTRYVVTDRRILIERAPPFSASAAIGLAQLPDLALREGRNGRGTIRFGPSANAFGNRSFGIWSPTLDPTPQFIAIDDVRGVYNLIQRLANDRSRA